MPRPQMSRVVVSVALLLTLVITPRVRTAQRTGSVKGLMRQVAAYVDAYGEHASIVVATEQYTQNARSRTPRTDGQAVRRLTAEFALVKLGSLGQWLGFRDVVEVDGRAVSDRQDRLVRILTESAGGYDDARRLSDESARFNIGGIVRSFNVPTATLFFFRAEHLDRFHFSAAGDSADGIREIAFRETSRPTLIRTPEGRSVPSQGSVWVNPADGTIVRTQLNVTDFVPPGTGRKGHGRVEVSYRPVPAFGMWLPAAMDEDFEVRGDGESETISGRALYSNYRQFQTFGRIK
jgi:hypothetical protein